MLDAISFMQDVLLLKLFLGRGGGRCRVISNKGGYITPLLHTKYMDSPHVSTEGRGLGS